MADLRIRSRRKITFKGFRQGGSAKQDVFARKRPSLPIRRRIKTLNVILRRALTVNGEPRTFPAADAPATLAALLALMGLDAAAIVAEVDGAIVARDAFARTPLASGARIELVRFVGGG